MFKNALVYRIESWTPADLADIEQRLQAARFVECAASQPESAGWVAPRGEAHAALAESVGGQLMFKLCTETKAVPGSVVKAQVEQKLDQIEKDTGRRPRGKIVRELKGEVLHGLLPRAFPKRSDTLVWLDAKAGLLWVGATSAKRADGIVTRLVELLGGGLKVVPLNTALSPAGAMSAWLSEKEAPAGFVIDRECELKQPDSEKATVRYTRHTLDIDEVGEHIRQGKQPTQLAMTWAGRVSFVLTETLTLKKIKLLDVVLEAKAQDDGGFDADVAITTGELQLLMPDLVAALGGLQERGAAPAAQPPALPAGTGDVAPWDELAAA